MSTIFVSQRPLANYGQNALSCQPLPSPSMPSRRKFDPLADTGRQHWLAISDMHGALVECTAIPAGARSG